MYKENLRQLKIYYPDLYKEIYEYNMDNNIDEKYKLVENKDKSSNILIDTNMYLHSKYDPLRESRIWVEGISLNEEDTIVIFGLGLGYYLDFLLEKFPDKKIIIIEPELDIFIQSLRVRNYIKYMDNENIVFIVNKDKYTVRHLIEHYIKNSKIKSLYFTHISLYKLLYEEYVNDIYKELNHLVMTLEGNLFTEIVSSERWIYNILRNIKFIKKYPTVNKLKDKLEGVPVIIVSAGPSLEKNIKLLNGIEEKALIVAVGSSANILESNDIQPHIIMAIDGNKSEGEIFKRLKSHKPLLIYNNVVHYESLISYKGNKMWLNLHSDKYMDEICEELDIKTNKFLTGGSIANLALDFAVWLKSSCIILLGQDLCYSGGKLYSDGAIHQNHITTKEQYIEEVDIHGEKVYTKTAFLNFKSWFEDYVEYSNINEGIYNCTEGGLSIKGIPNVKFQQVIDKYLVREYNIEGNLNSLFENKSNIDNKKYNDLMKKYQIELKECLKLSKKRISLLNKLINKYCTNDFDKLMDNTEELEKKDFYRYFIESIGVLYRDAIAIGTNSSLDKMEDVSEKRKRLLTGLKMQYENIDEILEVALAAIEERDVESLF